jgi:hypothetical protein
MSVEMNRMSDAGIMSVILFEFVIRDKEIINIPSEKGSGLVLDH